MNLCIYTIVKYVVCFILKNILKKEKPKNRRVNNVMHLI